MYSLYILDIIILDEYIEDCWVWVALSIKFVSKEPSDAEDIWLAKVFANIGTNAACWVRHDPETLYFCKSKTFNKSVLVYITQFNSLRPKLVKLDDSKQLFLGAIYISLSL